jgi:hypothetical protein
MVGMDAWDAVILAVAAYVAVMALVRLMSVQRRKVTEQLEAEVEAEQRRRRAEEKAQRRAAG